MATSFNTSVTMVVTLPDDVIENGTDTKTSPPIYVIIIQSLVFVIIWVISILTNILVCIVIYRSRRVQSTTNYFVVSMTISDLLLTLFCVPFAVSGILAQTWTLGSVMCRLVRFIQTLAPTSVFLILVSISVDRFYAILYPLSFKITRGTAKHLISGCWFMSFVMCIFSVYFYSPETDETDSQRLICPAFVPNNNIGSAIFGAIFVILTYILPTLFIFTVYTRLFRYVWTAGVRHRQVRRTTNPVARNKVKMLKMLIIVSALTLICATPYYSFQLYHAFSTIHTVHPAVICVTFLVLFLTTILKPLIYMMYNSNFRRGCREVFCMSSMKCYRSHTYAITTASSIGKKNHVGVMPLENGNQSDIRSPNFIFNRTIISEKIAWPASASQATTYL